MGHLRSTGGDYGFILEVIDRLEDIMGDVRSFGGGIGRYEVILGLRDCLEGGEDIMGSFWEIRHYFVDVIFVVTDRLEGVDGVM